MTEVRIRECRESELNEAESLYYKLYEGKEDIEPLSERIGEYCLVALKKDTVVGLLVAEVISTESMVTEIGRDAFPGEKKYLEIQELIILPKQRSKGIGSMLIEAVLKKAKENGIRRSMVYSSNQNYVETAKFYEKNGFNMWHIFMTQ